jgi:solute carrier family 32 (vesicular inhibitory amino acid transporter)
MLIFYLPVAIGGFIVFSTELSDNIIDKLDNNWIKTVVIVLITGHILSAFNIILNPVYQGIENALKAPESKYLT